MQLSLFNNHIEDLKKGKKVKCPCCGHEVRWYKKTLCQRLVGEAYEIYNYVNWKFGAFSFREVFKDDHHKVNDAQKLKYFGLIRKVDNNGLWKITQKGIDFLRGDISIPRAVWVYKNEVQMEDDVYVHVGEVEPRWQQCRADWAMDYVAVGFNNN